MVLHAHPLVRLSCMSCVVVYCCSVPHGCNVCVFYMSMEYLNSFSCAVDVLNLEQVTSVCNAESEMRTINVCDSYKMSEKLCFQDRNSDILWQKMKEGTKPWHLKLLPLQIFRTIWYHFHILVWISMKLILILSFHWHGAGSGSGNQLKRFFLVQAEKAFFPQLSRAILTVILNFTSQVFTKA